MTQMDNELSTMNTAAENDASWKAIVAEYHQPSLPRALWQVVNTLVPLGFIWYLMYHTMTISWWLTIPLAVLARSEEHTSELQSQ